MVSAALAAQVASASPWLDATLMVCKGFGERSTSDYQNPHVLRHLFKAHDPEARLNTTTDRVVICGAGLLTRDGNLPTYTLKPLQPREPVDLYWETPCNCLRRAGFGE